MRRARLVRDEPPVSSALEADVRNSCLPIGGPKDLDRLVERVGTARIVLLGEASHGTEEYYIWRAAISERLIEEKGFSFIAVEGDWPDCYRINRYVRDFADAGESARDVLHAFERWPTWMWANEEVAALAEWLRAHNAGRAADRRVGFYGLDVYSLWESLYAILGYLQRVDLSALPAARRAFRCFEPYAEDVQRYARATLLVPASCEDEVVALLAEIRRKAALHGADGREAYFEAEQNAHAVRDAESYYRAMVRGGPDSWNIRDRHMADTLQRILQHHGSGAKAIVWEHNTHVGDARYTDMAREGLFNLGQLVRETHEDGVVIVGFASYQGSVTAGREWGAPAECMRVPPAREGSWEHLVHETRAPGTTALLFLPPRASPEMLQPRGHRAIGVVYHPELEHLGNYVPSVLPRRYDAVLFLDRTRAVRPLGVLARAEDEVPETYPSGV
jgi:erythromycin esterase-like protein